MKNRGFAITGILYSILVLFLILLALLVFSLQNKKTILDRLKSNTMDEIEGVVKGKSSDNSGVTIDTTDQYSSAEVKQLGLKGVVYLDPTDLSKYCNADNSTIGSGTSGCMKWYIYDDSDNNYKMILDHNTENGVVWNSSGVNVAYASSGAYTSIQNLVTNNNWDSSLNTTIITVAEINAITEKTGFDTTSAASYYFFTNPDKGQTPVANSKGASKYAWLYDYTNDCASYGCNVSTSGEGDYGYWTQDTVGSANSGTAVWLVDRNDSLYPIDANHGSRGVRPVITIAKSTVNTNLCIYDANHEFAFDYTGSAQTFKTPCSGNYKVELWGAYGGSYGVKSQGNGGYVSGELILNENDIFYLYIGATNKNFNYGTQSYHAAGGATDIRIVDGAWNNAASLRSRIMVAGGGGAAGGLNSWNSGTPYGGSAGGLISYSGGSMNNGSGGGGANQTSGYSFGVAGGSNAGGSGYYSGRSGYYDNGVAGSGGGSSFISGHTGCVAITSATNQSPKSGCTTGTTNNECSKHYSGFVFTNTKMIDGAGYSWTNVKGSLEQMPMPLGGYYESGKGHTGNGYAKITYLGK